MKLKLLEPEYANFTGQMGGVDFTNGVSNYGISPQRAATIQLVTTGVMLDETQALQAQLAALQAEFNAYKLAHPAT